jgi:hypothetical protein
MKFNPYSHSKLDVWRGCPYKFKLTYIDKIKIEKGGTLALFRGSYFHHYIETKSNDFKTNEIFTEKHKQECDSILETFLESDVAKKYLSKNGNFEEKFSFNSKLELLEYKDKSSWLKGSIDYYFVEGDVLTIVDWKSGKVPWETSDNQTKVYAIYGFLKFPEVQEVKANFVYIEHCLEKSFTYKREDLKKLLKELFDTTRFAENDSTFIKRPTVLCDYCDFKTFGHCDGTIELKLSSFGSW